MWNSFTSLVFFRIPYNSGSLFLFCSMICPKWAWNAMLFSFILRYSHQITSSWLSLSSWLAQPVTDNSQHCDFPNCVDKFRYMYSATWVSWVLHILYVPNQSNHIKKSHDSGSREKFNCAVPMIFMWIAPSLAPQGPSTELGLVLNITRCSKNKAKYVLFLINGFSINSEIYPMTFFPLNRLDK